MRTWIPRRIALTGAILLPLAACETTTDPGEPIDQLPRALSASEQSVIDASNDFAFGLLRLTSTAEPTDNVFLSPLSVSMALGMTMNGAAGTTYDQMRSTLGFGTLPQTEINAAYRDLIDLLLELDPGVDIGVANSVWYRAGFPFENSFFQTVESNFGAEVQGIDFTDPNAPTQVNNWVAQATKNRIDRILDSIEKDDVMFLINAIYFKGSWRQRFDKSDTHDDQFTTLSGSRIPVKMMSGKVSVGTGLTSDYQIIDLPYGNGAYSMTILLPKSHDGINALASRLDAEEWDQAISLITSRQELDVSLPKFRLEYDTTLNDALKAMGMPQAFVRGGADFSGMSRVAGPDLYISEVKHKTFVQVDEEGTEAAAVTQVGISVTSLPVGIRVDRPFIVAIRERLSGTILFLGKVMAPEA